MPSGGREKNANPVRWGARLSLGLIRVSSCACRSPLGYDALRVSCVTAPFAATTSAAAAEHVLVVQAAEVKDLSKVDLAFGAGPAAKLAALPAAGPLLS